MDTLKLQRKLEDINDKLCDLGFAAVEMRDVVQHASVERLPKPVLSLLRLMLAEVDGAHGAQAGLQTGLRISEKLKARGLEEVHGPQPAPLDVLDFLSSELQSLRLTAFHLNERPAAAQAGTAGAPLSSSSTTTADAGCSRRPISPRASA